MTTQEIEAFNFLTDKGWEEGEIKRHLSGIVAELDMYEMTFKDYYISFMSDSSTQVGTFEKQIRHLHRFMRVPHSIIEDLRVQNRRLILADVVIVILFIIDTVFIRG